MYDTVEKAKQDLEQRLEEEESFRDSISTVDEEGKRKWVYPKKPKGRYTKYRSIVAVFLLALFFTGPFIRIGGQPLLQIGILERKFIIFGQIFFPHDFWLFGLAMITGVIFVSLFTVVYGRVFCGWVCPQTIFMEMVFRKIEYWIEGDRGKQITLNKKPWTGEKIRKKTLKHSAFFGVSFLISNTFLSYIIGSDQWLAIITDPPTQHIVGLLSILLFSGVFYFIFAFMREQVCTTVCPYGRLQGVLLDDRSIVVAYDHKRGEPRGKFKKREDRDKAGKGDCIDCHQCVDVCPTGIDIRNGTQLECVNCTACIDACDAIMDKIGKPRGLIRFASEKNIREGKKFQFTTRMAAYTFVLVALLGVLTAFLVTRNDIQTTIYRTRGMTYQKAGEGRYSNLYNYKVTNKTTRELSLSFSLDKEGGDLQLAGEKNRIHLGSQGVNEGVFFIYLDEEQMDGMKTPMEVLVKNKEGKVLERVETTFMGPYR